MLYESLLTLRGSVALSEKNLLKSGRRASKIMIFVMLAKSGFKVKPETIKISGALLYLSLRL